MLNKRKVQQDILRKEVDINNLHEHTVDYYRQLLQFVECRVDIRISELYYASHSPADCYGTSPACIRLHPSDPLWVWVHEAAHHLYMYLDTTQRNRLKEVVCEMCTTCYHFKEKMSKYITTPYQGYVYSALTDAYMIYHKNNSMLCDTVYVQRHLDEYGYDNPEEYATQEAWASICELIMYDLKPPKRLEKLHAIASALLEELMIELL